MHNQEKILEYPPQYTVTDNAFFVIQTVCKVYECNILS